LRDVEEDEEDIEILYYVPQLKFDEVKRKLKARLAKNVGEKTFEYYYSMECE